MHSSPRVAECGVGDQLPNHTSPTRPGGHQRRLCRPPREGDGARHHRRRARGAVQRRAQRQGGRQRRRRQGAARGPALAFCFGCRRGPTSPLLLSRACLSCLERSQQQPIPASHPTKSPTPMQVGAAGRAVGEKLHDAGEEVEEAASRNKTAVYTGGRGRGAGGPLWDAGSTQAAHAFPANVGPTATGASIHCGASTLVSTTAMLTPRLFARSAHSHGRRCGHWPADCALPGDAARDQGPPGGQLPPRRR